MKSEIQSIEADTLLSKLTQAKDELGFTLLLDITAVDNLHKKHPASSRFELIYILRHSSFLTTKIFKVAVQNPEEGVQSISPIYASAEWAEREVYDQYGINFIKHPLLKRVLNHNEFIGHPLRKDYEITKGQYCTQAQDLMDEMKPLLDSRGLDIEQDNLMILNLGPSHPASHGTIRTLTALDGEKIVGAVTEIGYLHRGFEKSCENHNYNQIIPYTDRLNYCSALMNNIAFAKAVEEMLDITLPDRGIFIRVILGELSRIIDHLVCLAAALLDMGAQTNYWYLFNPRNDANEFLSKLTGARLTNSYMRIGGMAYDLYEGWQDDLKEILKSIDEGVTDTLKMIKTNKIYYDRLINVSPISAKEAIDFGLSGPILRASGVAYDARFTKPYYYYDTFDFNMVVGSTGDTYDRLMVRFDEIHESMKVLKQAMAQIPDGEFNVDDKRIIMPSKDCVYGAIEPMMNQFKLVIDGVKVPESEHYSSYEATNGELGFYIQSDGTGTPYKVKVRAPSFYHIAAYPKVIEGSQIADAILTLGSFNVIAGEMDR